MIGNKNKKSRNVPTDRQNELLISLEIWKNMTVLHLHELAFLIDPKMVKDDNRSLANSK